MTMDNTPRDAEANICMGVEHSQGDMSQVQYCVDNTTFEPGPRAEAHNMIASKATDERESGEGNASSPHNASQRHKGASWESVDYFNDDDTMETSSSKMADAYSNCLADVAIKTAPQSPHESTCKTNDASALISPHVSRSDGKHSSSGSSSDDAATGESANVVTTHSSSAQTGTMSSGEDRDSGSGDANARGSRSEGTSSMSSENTTTGSAPNPTAREAHRGQHRHHSHRLPFHRSHHQTTRLRQSLTRLERDHERKLSFQVLESVDGRVEGNSDVTPTKVSSRVPPSTWSSTNSTCESGSEESSDSSSHPQHRAVHSIRSLDASRSQHGVAVKSSTSEEVSICAETKDKTGILKASTIRDVMPPIDKSERRENVHGVGLAKPPPNGRSPSPEEDPNMDEGGGSSSGSGTEAGYMGSEDSKENGSSSPSVSSLDRSQKKGRKKHKRLRGSKTGEFVSQVNQEMTREDESADSSSELADFSSGSTNSSETNGESCIIEEYNSESRSLSSSNDDEGASSEDGYKETYIQMRNQVLPKVLKATTLRRKAVISEPRSIKCGFRPKARISLKADRTQIKEDSAAVILNVGSDMMAHILSFLAPPTVLNVLTMPLSKEWRVNFTTEPDLWRVLCQLEPFKANINDRADEDMDDISSTDSYCSLNIGSPEASNERLLDRYRLLYTSFVRCMKYLTQIREDATNGRPPSYIDYGVLGDNSASTNNVGESRKLQGLFVRARPPSDEAKEASDGTSSSEEKPQQVVACGIASLQTDIRKRKSGSRHRRKPKKIKTARSMITDRLLGPSATGEPGFLDLPWSCAIYSIVNWMVSFNDVEGIQVLPFLLEDEQQRQTAQRAGLTDVVLRAMVFFPDSVQLHTAAFHTIVLLARPLGGREGMLFHSSMTLTGILGIELSHHPKNGIAVLLDSMKRFVDNAVLQAMSCWALVNIALAPAQKAELVKMGGIQATSDAMSRHPFSAEVQFRSLFALINLVIPSVRMNGEEALEGALGERRQQVHHHDPSEKEMIDGMVGEITSLVVRAMKNFCSSEAILNRACLVLHNLSLSQEYHTTLLWTHDCYQMLEWCLANYRTDQVLQQSASGTLHRLQSTLSSNDDLRARFTAELQSQQQMSLAQAHQEALRLHQQHDEFQQREQR